MRAGECIYVLYDREGPDFRIRPYWGENRIKSNYYCECLIQVIFLNTRSSGSDATARWFYLFISQSEAACGCHRQLSFIKFEAIVLTSGSSTCILQTSPLVLSEVEYLNGCFFLSQ